MMNINNALVAAYRTKVANACIIPGNTQADVYRYKVLNAAINGAVKLTCYASDEADVDFTLDQWSDAFEVNMMCVTSAMQAQEFGVINDFFKV